MAPVIKQKPKKSPKKVDNADVKEEVVSAQLQKKINKKKPPQPKKEDRGVVFIKHLPHGFFEQQLKCYFDQFGKVTRLRLARSKSSGGSKGYAFVEFEYPEVAQVAAETMDNYLMFKKLIKASYIPPEKQKYNYFKSSVHAIKNKSGKTIWVSNKTASIHNKMKQHNDWSEENFQTRMSKQMKKLKKVGERCAHLGIDINEILLEPKKISADEKAASSSKASKRKNEKESTDQKKTKKQPKLEDLLGNTIQEDSEDEDYIAVPGDDAESDGGQSSDDESYGFLNDVAEEDNSDESDEDVVEEERPVENVKKPKANFGKSLKSSNIERFDQMLKRKPHTGGIQKSNKKPPPKNVSSKSKNKMQLSAAKEVAKPLSKVQGRVGKGAKPLKKSKKGK